MAGTRRVRRSFRVAASSHAREEGLRCPLQTTPRLGVRRALLAVVVHCKSQGDPLSLTPARAPLRAEGLRSQGLKGPRRRIGEPSYARFRTRACP
jgi:hypothetical protein